ncbi:hypothetical protein ROZALSC1DRAFT_28504 [Rozella allomycis CSF55]|uniref:Bud22 domain-containing protein n=1 Tax=Rozella allomycis (strain CSF55) TaxID=988480 RepID=A0A4V1J012_ROZAC|nr:hypothetical protein ROZALSC1DRAFT_28504 [Rozella allomycis CSF55]
MGKDEKDVDDFFLAAEDEQAISEDEYNSSETSSDEKETPLSKKQKWDNLTEEEKDFKRKKLYLIRKLIRNIKSYPNSNEKYVKKLDKFKHLDMKAVSIKIFNEKILSNVDPARLVWEKLQTKPESEAKIEDNILQAILEDKKLHEILDNATGDFEAFLEERKTKETQPKKKQKPKKRVRNTLKDKMKRLKRRMKDQKEEELVDEMSEEEEIDVEPMKKNRMGQRARKQLWEKLYGNEADHLKKPKPKTVKEEKMNKQKESADTELHPSWALKKEMNKSKPFEGKKIVFDE